MVKLAEELSTLTKFTFCPGVPLLKSMSLVPKNVVSEACSPSYEDALISNDIELYKGIDPCSVLQSMFKPDVIPSFPIGDAMVPFCSKLGPFSLDKNINSTVGSFKDARLVLQNLCCKSETYGSGHIVKVSSFFRVFDSAKTLYYASHRTGLNNMTLSAVGQWNHTSGKLCMIGCLGLSNECNSRVVLYIPLSFAIKQRTIIMGTISSKETNSSYFPLFFEMIVRNMQHLDQYTTDQPYHQYSETDSSTFILERDESLSGSTVIKKLLVQYPKAGTNELLLSSLSYLAEDLTLHTAAFHYPIPVPFTSPPKTNVNLDIVSLRPLFCRSMQNETSLDEETQYKTRLNISTHSF